MESISMLPVAYNPCKNKVLCFLKLRMSTLYPHKAQVHLHGAAMLHCYSSPEQINHQKQLAYCIFTSRSINSE